MSFKKVIDKLIDIIIADNISNITSNALFGFGKISKKTDNKELLNLIELSSDTETSETKNNKENEGDEDKI